MENRVSVIIPTRNRPALVVRAIRSALAQTHPIHEVVVVIDGPDGATVDALEKLGSSKIRWIMFPERRGANHARNTGASSSVCDWVAFLDDDDEWLSNKVSTQLAIAGHCDIVSCRFFARSSNETTIWPRKLPAKDQAFGDYLFARRSIFNGEAAIITSTLMIQKSLFDEMPFSPTLRRHQDADWVIRATEKGSRIVYAPQALVQFDDEIERTRISTSYEWRESLEWIRSVHRVLGGKAYAGFVLTSIGPAASDKREWNAAPMLLREAFAKGKPTLLHLILYFGMWIFPQRMRQMFRAHISAMKRTSLLSFATKRTDITQSESCFNKQQPIGKYEPNNNNNLWQMK